MEPIHKLPAITLGEPFGLGAVDLWCFFYEEVTDGELLCAYNELMTQEERARHRRFHFERDRLMFLATRALVRTVLSNYAQVLPSCWRFAEGEYGRPYIVGGPAALNFNLTNTPGLAACVVSGCHPIVGVDAEWVGRPGETINVADRYFSPLELRGLHSQPAAHQRNRFFSYWTLKESYIKARGLGLSLPLDQFSFFLDNGPPIRIRFNSQIRDDPERWQFALVSPSERHVVAVAVMTDGAPLVLRAANFVPLRGAIPFELTST
jgi:4'-phosphopantetheinyl transferase